MDREQVTGGIFRGLLTGGSWVRLLMWAKNTDAREVVLTVKYLERQANWTLVLLDNEREVFRGSGGSFEEITVLAVAALGKSL